MLRQQWLNASGIDSQIDDAPPHWMSQLESTLNGRSPPLPRITVSRVDPGTSAHMQKRAGSEGTPPSLVGSV